MANPVKVFNPFYALLVVVGTLFAITACGYASMIVVERKEYGSTITEAKPSDASHDSLSHVIFSDYGMQLMVGELAVLALATFGAIATDEYWTRRAEAKLSTQQTQEQKGD